MEGGEGNPAKPGNSRRVTTTQSRPYMTCATTDSQCAEFICCAPSDAQGEVWALFSWCSRHRGLWLDSRPIQSGILHSKTPYEREGGMRRAPNGPHNETQIQWAPSGSVLVGFCVRVSKHLTTRYWETSSFPHHVSMRVGILHSGIHEEQQEITSLCWTGPESGPLLNTAEDSKNLCATAGTCVSLVCKWAQVIEKKNLKCKVKY